jgi:hypothetical protein
VIIGLAVLVAAHAADMTTAAWTDALTLTDRVGWSSSPRDIAAFAAESTAPTSLFAHSYNDANAGHAAVLDRPPVYAVEAELQGNFLFINMAVVYTNRSRVPIRTVVFRVLGNGRGDPVDLTTFGTVWADGVLVPWSLRGTLLEVGLSGPLRPGQRTRIQLELAQHIPKYNPDPDRWPRQITALGTGAFGHAHGDFALGFWLPQITRLAPNGVWDERPLPMSGEHTWFEPAQYHVVLDLPSTFAVATTGVEVNRATTGTRTRIVVVASGARDFAIHLARGYTITSEVVEGVRIRAFYPDNRPEIGVRLLRWGGRAVTLFTKWFGPLPIRELDIVDAHVRVALGMEYDGLVTIDARTRKGDLRDPDGLEWTVVHEVAHQWWYAEVGNDSQAEPWLDEGLANASTALYWEAVHGRDALEYRWRQDVIEPYRAMLEDGIHDVPANLHGEAYLLEQYASVIYGRSALFLDRVRAEIGDDAFTTALTAYHAEYHCKSARGEDLIRHLKRQTEDPGQIDFLFVRWIAEAHAAEDVIPSDR